MSLCFAINNWIAENQLTLVKTNQSVKILLALLQLSHHSILNTRRLIVVVFLNYQLSGVNLSFCYKANSTNMCDKNTIVEVLSRILGKRSYL